MYDDVIAVSVGRGELLEEGLVLGGAAGRVHGDGERDEFHDALQELGV